MFDIAAMTKDEQDEISSVRHTSVMLNEVLEHLELKKGGVYLDCTLGLAGHAQAILERIGPGGTLIGLDRDGQSLEFAKEKLSNYSHQCHFLQSDFRSLDTCLDDLKITHVDGILMDLGVSSYQLEDPQRGFSIKSDGPLDMRMDQNAHISAYDLTNSLSENEISSLIYEFGQERWAKRIARYIVAQRLKKPIETTKELRHIVMRAIPNTKKRYRIHPATRTFQAFRIAVNRELESINVSLIKAITCLKEGGRLLVISFHSLEDKIVKDQFRSLAKENLILRINKKPLRPTEKETKENPRSRSARLRIVERI